MVSAIPSPVAEVLQYLLVRSEKLALIYGSDVLIVRPPAYESEIQTFDRVNIKLKSGPTYRNPSVLRRTLSIHLSARLFDLTTVCVIRLPLFRKNETLMSCAIREPLIMKSTPLIIFLSVAALSGETLCGYHEHTRSMPHVYRAYGKAKSASRCG